MITFTSDAWKNIDYARLVPNDKNSFLYFLSRKTALHIRNICDWNKKMFSIKNAMTSELHKEIFFNEQELKDMEAEDGKTKVFQEKLKSFAQYMDVNLERFFITHKRPKYLFFDEKEQDVMQHIMTSVPWFCRVEVMAKKHGKFVMIPFEELSDVGYSHLKAMLGGVQLKAELPMDDYRVLCGGKIQKKPIDFDELTVNRIFKEYPDLKTVKTLKDYKAVVRATLKQLHPDTNDEDTSEAFNKFKEATATLETTKWYKTLKGDDKSGAK